MLHWTYNETQLIYIIKIDVIDFIFTTFNLNYCASEIIHTRGQNKDLFYLNNALIEY